jgi:hypothetical protein
MRRSYRVPPKETKKPDRDAPEEAKASKKRPRISDMRKALTVERKSRRPSNEGKRVKVYAADFLTAQQRIKKSLNIDNQVSAHLFIEKKPSFLFPSVPRLTLKDTKQTGPC